MKKVMPFVALVRDRVNLLGKSAMAVTVDFDEKEVLTVNLEYLRNTLDLETLNICFTDDPTASDKMKEEVCPGLPFIVYTTKPTITINIENPIPRSGLFSQFLNVAEGDSTKLLKEKLAKSLGLTEVELFQIWRYEDPLLGPRKIPNFNDYKTGKVQLEDGTISIDKTIEAIYITTLEGKKIEVGTSFIYIIV